MDYIMITLATVLLAVNFAFSKIYQDKEGTAVTKGLYFNMLTGVFTAFTFFVICGFKIEITPYSMVMTTIKEILVVVYTLIGFKIMERGSMALYTLFLMSGGMTVPYVWGLAFLDEPFTVLRLFGLIFVLLGVILPNISKEKTDTKQLILCIGVFFLNGFVSVTSKLHQIETVYPTVGADTFVLLGGIVKFVLVGIIYFIVRKKESTSKEKVKPKMIAVIALAAIVSGVSFLMQLWGASTLPATVLYPFITGGTVLFTSVAGVVFFKDKLSTKMILSIVFCFVGTLLFL